LSKSGPAKSNGVKSNGAKSGAASVRHRASGAKAQPAGADANGAGADAAKSPSAPAHLPWFTRFAQSTAHFAGQPATFMAAVALIVIWAVSGPVFGYSDAWQLVINTGTTIVTFLMVFLIQNSQNRDSMEIQLKLSELVLAVRGARNRLATIEDLSDEELESLHRESHQRAEAACRTLEERRSAKQRQSEAAKT